MVSPSWKRNNGAAIEGLPLYLMIIVIITAVSIGIIMGMLGMVKPPSTLGQTGLSVSAFVLSDPDRDGTYSNISLNLTVTVTDGSGNRLAGAVVVLSGNSIKTPAGTNPYATTDSKGEAKFSNLQCSVMGSSANPVLISIEKSGYGKKSLDIPVVCE